MNFFLLYLYVLAALLGVFCIILAFKYFPNLLSTITKEEEKKPVKSPLIPKFSILPERSSPMNISNMSPLSNKSLNSSLITSTPNNVSFTSTMSPNVSMDSSWGPSLDRLPNQSPEDSPSGLLRKRIPSKTGLSPKITDEYGLKKYLKSYEEIKDKVQEMSKVEQQRGQYFPMQKSKDDLPNLCYQVSDDSLVATDMDVEDNFSATNRSIDSICLRLNVTPNKLTQWTQNIKNWILSNILSNIVKDIDKINETLTKAGLVASLIGEVGLSSLKQLENTKSKDIPTLSCVLPYLELTIYQEYLINRLRDLVKRNSFSDFTWNRGAPFKGNPWSDEWPTDAQIIMHCFCTYFNLKLPSNPNYPDAKPFTGQHFRLISGSNNEKISSQKNQIYILQTRINPPHFNVAPKEDDIIEIPPGKNNVFHALIVFLYFIKTKHYGFLSRLNLGPTGLNILCNIE